MSEETNNDSFKANMIAEIKKIQEELNELKNIKNNIGRTPARKATAEKKAVKKKPARKATAEKKAVKKKPARKATKPKRKSNM